MSDPFSSFGQAEFGYKVDRFLRRITPRHRTRVNWAKLILFTGGIMILTGLTGPFTWQRVALFWLGTFLVLCAV